MLYDPERRWVVKALCKGADTGLFFVDAGNPAKKPSAATQRFWDTIKEDYCEACPVLAECRRDTLGEMYGVWGGRDQYERSQLRVRLAKAIKGWPEEERLTWGKELHRLRSSGLVFRDIQRMTGIPEVPAAYLIKVWVAHQEAAEAAALAAPAPEPPAPEPAQPPEPFPRSPGSRHCWVRNNGIIQDAFYRAETEDGAWVLVQLSNRGRSSAVIKWIAVDDVDLYNPQARVVRKRKARMGDGVNGLKDRCKHGHRFTPQNTRKDAHGRRQCRTCLRARKEAMSRAAA